MSVVSMNVPEEVFLDIHKDKDEFTDYVKKVVALDLYKDKKVSLGYCASVADMTKEEFIQYISINGISIFSFESEDGFVEELSNA
jgi:predicted HTH domain antitoxin